MGAFFRCWLASTKEAAPASLFPVRREHSFSIWFCRGIGQPSSILPRTIAAGLHNLCRADSGISPHSCESIPGCSSTAPSARPRHPVWLPEQAHNSFPLLSLKQPASRDRIICSTSPGGGAFLCIFIQIELHLFNTFVLQPNNPDRFIIQTLCLRV